MKLTQSLMLDLLPAEGSAGVTTAQIHERLSSRALETKWLKSIRRLLQRLEDEGLAFSEKQGRHLYWWRREGTGGMAGSRKRMTLGEALALRLLNMATDAYQLPWIVRTELNAMFKTAQISLEKTPIGDAHKSWMDRIAILDEGYARMTPAINPEIAETVSMALFRTLRLTLRYLPVANTPEKQPPQPVLIEPLGWVSRNKLHYLVARKAETGELRHYRIDRIQAAALGNAFLYPGDFSLKSHVEDDSAFDYPGLGKKETIVLCFERAWGAHLIDTPVNDTQVIVAQTDASMTVRFEAWDSERLLWWIRGFGPHVEVLDPGHLRHAFAQEFAQAARIYAGETTDRP